VGYFSVRDRESNYARGYSDGFLAAQMGMIPPKELIAKKADFTPYDRGYFDGRRAFVVGSTLAPRVPGDYVPPKDVPKRRAAQLRKTLA